MRLTRTRGAINASLLNAIKRRAVWVVAVDATAAGDDSDASGVHQCGRLSVGVGLSRSRYRQRSNNQDEIQDLHGEAEESRMRALTGNAKFATNARGSSVGLSVPDVPPHALTAAY